MWKIISTLFHRSSDAPIGRRGEELAARHLQSLGYKIIQRNFLTPLGEIDIPLSRRDGNTLVFVEVKTRMQDEPTLRKIRSIAINNINSRASANFISADILPRQRRGSM